MKNSKKNVDSKNIRKKGATKMPKEVYIALFSVCLGSALTLLSTYSYDILKEKHRKTKLAKMIYIDVKNTRTTLYTILQKLPEQEAYKHDFLTMNNFDIRIFETYLQEIPMLSMVDASRIIAFYGELQKANEVVHILRNEEHLSPENRKFWMKNFYDRIYKCTRNGKRIMEDLEKQYNIKPLKDIKDKMNKAEKIIIERNPELEDKIKIPDGQL